MFPVEKNYEFIYHSLEPELMLLNKRQRKRVELQNRYEELKVIVPYPEVFKLEDATCDDPVFHNRMKKKGVVSVPEYWRSNSGRMFPKDYIKPRYKIPLNIVNTGIPELRRILREEEAEVSLRSKVREKLYPRLGKSLVDQRTLRDAFIRKPINPKLTRYGDVFAPKFEYFMNQCVPGVLGMDLLDALGISEKTPPPWLFKMQKRGIPPSYPNVRIPGLNGPIPEGCKYGFQPGEWGRPLLEQTSDAVCEEEQIVLLEHNQYIDPIYIEEELEEIIDEFVDVKETTIDDNKDEESKCVIKEDGTNVKKKKQGKEKPYGKVRF